MLGLDALSSSAYGPEAALTLLLPLGALGVLYILPLTAVIIGVLVIVYFSYRQTIAAYPMGGGSYAVAKENLFYYVTIGAMLTVLPLSANTSFAGFPRLCQIVARDDFLPHTFAIRGRRLVFSLGIYVLTAFAAILMIIFGGITDGSFYSIRTSSKGRCVCAAIARTRPAMVS